MTDNSELILSDKNSGKLQDLKSALEGIEVTYALWLNGRKNSLTGEQPDRLGNYFRYFYTEKGIQFYVKDNLPQEIKNACWSAYKNIFGNS